MRRLQLVQNAADCLIKGLTKRHHITPTLYELNWLPIEPRMNFKVMLLVYKALHGQGPEYLSELLIPYKPARSLRSASSNKLIVPKCHYADTQKRAFGVCAPKMWNDLPRSVREKESIEMFKSALKTHLFRIAFQ